MIKKWRVTAMVYRPETPNRKQMMFLDATGPNEQTVRRLVLDAAHERGQFIDEFKKIERSD